MRETFESLLDRAIECLEEYAGDESEELAYIKEEREKLEALETADFNAPIAFDFGIEQNITKLNNVLREMRL